MSETAFPAKPRPKADWHRMIETIPIKNAAASVIEASGQRVQIRVRNRRPRWHRGLLAFLIPLRQERQVELDALGSVIWRACDGKTKVGDLIREFAIRERLEWHESRLLVTGALKGMIERGILAVALP